MDLMNLTNIHIQHSTSESLEEKPRLQEITWSDIVQFCRKDVNGVVQIESLCVEVDRLLSF